MNCPECGSELVLHCKHERYACANEKCRARNGYWENGLWIANKEITLDELFEKMTQPVRPLVCKLIA